MISIDLFNANALPVKMQKNCVKATAYIVLTSLRPKDTCIHLDAVEEHGTNVTSLPASYRMMSG